MKKTGIMLSLALAVLVYFMWINVSNGGNSGFAVEGLGVQRVTCEHVWRRACTNTLKGFRAQRSTLKGYSAELGVIPWYTVDTKNPAGPLSTIMPLFPRFRVFRVMQDFQYPP